MKPEALVKKAVREILTANNIWFFMPVSFGMGYSGVPDFICCWGGRFLAIETKAGSAKPTKLQDKVMQSISDHGGHVLVVNEANLETLKEILKRGVTNGVCSAWR
jgi:hypothetical protein